MKLILTELSEMKFYLNSLPNYRKNTAAVKVAQEWQPEPDRNSPLHRSTLAPYTTRLRTPLMLRRYTRRQRIEEGGHWRKFPIRLLASSGVRVAM